MIQDEMKYNICSVAKHSNRCSQYAVKHEILLKIYLLQHSHVPNCTIFTRFLILIIMLYAARQTGPAISLGPICCERLRKKT